MPHDTDPDKEDLGRRIKSALAVALSLVILVGGGIFVLVKANDAWYAFRTVEDYIGEGKDEIEISIPRGSSLTAIGELLVSKDVVKTSRAFSSAVNSTPEANKIQAGRYRLKTQLPAQKALDMLLDPNNMIRIQFTLQEGLTLKQAVPIMAKASGLTEKDFWTAFRDPDALGLPSWSGKKAEGFIFPETYELPQNPTATQIIKMTTSQFTKVTDSMNFTNRAAENDVSPFQALTIASIIEAEVHNPDYQAKVSRVIYNRLAKGMPLQMDSTVHYAVGKSGSVTTTEAERNTKSPYNTYLNKGLPPGPIGSPGAKALEAAISPEAGDWLYFVTVNLDTGETVFASTLEEHNQNVAKFQQWCNDHSGRC
jgi:UPF0755 protein